MIGFIAALGLAAIAIITTTMRKAYELVPDFELRRQAQAGDDLARVLYRAVSYGPAAQLLLWILSLLTIAASVGVMAMVVPVFVLFVYSLVVIGYTLVWLPRADVTNFGVKSVVWATPVFMWLLGHVFTFLEKPAQSMTQRQADTHHTGLYEREDVLKLLEQQKEQADNRLTENEINQLLHAITYSHKTVSQIMKPRKKIRMVALHEAIGPILMDELHASNNSFFPVCEPDDPEHVVGLLYMSDLLHVKNGGYVRDVMRPEVFYVNEDFTVEQLLHAFLKTKQQVLVVINVFEEWVGLVTIGNALRHVIGHTIESDFNNYDSRAAVAAFKQRIVESVADLPDSMKTGSTMTDKHTVAHGQTVHPSAHPTSQAKISKKTGVEHTAPIKKPTQSHEQPSTHFEHKATTKH